MPEATHTEADGGSAPREAAIIGAEARAAAPHPTDPGDDRAWKAAPQATFGGGCRKDGSAHQANVRGAARSLDPPARHRGGTAAADEALVHARSRNADEG
jgi:hypothetical protein